VIRMGQHSFGEDFDPARTSPSQRGTRYAPVPSRRGDTAMPTSGVLEVIDFEEADTALAVAFVDDGGVGT
jgi:hypothetical protein